MDITNETFDKQVIQDSSNIPVLVDFWAPWCGPCQMLKPSMEALAEEYKDKVKIVKLNVEENQEKAQEYGIMSIPNVKLFKEGKVVDQFMGAKPKEDIQEWIDERI